MGEIVIEPMVQIFLEETSSILSEMEEKMEQARERGKFDHEQINDIFRYIHTIKANAAMMLYEDIAKPARELEKVLYHYRDEVSEIEDNESFLKLLHENLSFYQEELEKLMNGLDMDGDSTKLTEHIRSYLIKAKGEEAHEKSSKKQEEAQENEQQFFYISGKKETKETTAKKESVPETSKWKRQRHVLVSVEEIEALDAINLHLLKYANTLSPDIQVLLREIDSWLWRVNSTDFTLVASKLNMTVKDMLKHIDKKVDFHVTGSGLTIEKAKVDKISNALIHLVRNAVDHGIETPGERRLYGKSERGYVNVDIEEMQNHAGIRIRVSDDGRGLNMYRLLDKAKAKGILTKPYEEYTEAEAFELIFHPGFTTRSIAGEYSGRGVGMDAARHNLEEIGGTICVESVYGVGTSFIMEIAYDINSGHDDQSKKGALLDESINSRR